MLATAVTVLAGATHHAAVFAEAAPTKGPSFGWVLSIERAVYTIVMLALAIAAGWTGLRKGGKPAHAIDFLVVAAIVGFIYQLVDPAYLTGLYGAVSGFVNGTNG